jgi:hypothetical protein
MLAWYWDEDRVLAAMKQVHINAMRVSNLQGLNWCDLKEALK